MAKEKEYNSMYDSLVSSDDDIEGLLAYSIYKRYKRKFIISHKEKNGTDPNDKEIGDFMTSAFCHLDSYRKEGQEVFFHCVGNCVREELAKSDEHKKLVEKLVDATQTEIGKVEKKYDETISKIVLKHTFRWYSTVGLNLLATISFSIILGVGYFLLQTSERETGDTMKKLMGKSMTEIPSDSILLNKIPSL